MVDTKKVYFIRGQVVPRIPQLVKDPAFWISLLLGGLVGYLAPQIHGGTLTVAEAGNIGITYASISMGVATTALVLSLGLPGAERMHRWANLPEATPGRSMVSDLVFVLAWSAMCQLALITYCLALILTVGDVKVFPTDPCLWHRITLGVGVGLLTYSLFELRDAITTLVQVGTVIEAEEQAAASSPDATDDLNSAA